LSKGTNYTIMEFASNKKKSLLKILIAFFATIYDLGYAFIKLLIDFFASLYDMVYIFIFFIWEYIKWTADIRPVMPQNITTQAKESITNKS
jgi:hypothetical protein